MDQNIFYYLIVSMTKKERIDRIKRIIIPECTVVLDLHIAS